MRVISLFALCVFVCAGVVAAVAAPVSFKPLRMQEQEQEQDQKQEHETTSVS